MVMNALQKYPHKIRMDDASKPYTPKIPEKLLIEIRVFNKL